MSEVIEREINKIINIAKRKNVVLTKPQAFDYLICSVMCYNSLQYEEKWYDLFNDSITDKSNDGGIDFVFYDEEAAKVIVGQNKYSDKQTVNDVVAELQKINTTLKNFFKGKTATYNDKLKRILQNAIDRLPEENDENIKIIFSSFSEFNQEKVKSKLEEELSYLELMFYGTKDIEKKFEELQTTLHVVKEFSFAVDEPKNILCYKSKKYDGVVLNIKASSLKKAFEQYDSKGLFNLNIRRYIQSKNVDAGIIDSIVKNNTDFWFKNNGITIACNDYRVDGNTIKIYGFSIVNGGQTTTLIAKHFDSLKNDFSVMCKVVKSVEKLEEEEAMGFFNEIAEATNSQKPIQPRDLRANSREMVQLQQLLKDREYFLEIKRGIRVPHKYKDKHIKNDVLAQLIYSFVYQKPGTARSNKNGLFSNDSWYKRIFCQSYSKDANKINFLVDLIQLSKRMDEGIKSFKAGTAYTSLTIEQLDVISNSTLLLIALSGVVYRIINKDVDINIEMPNLGTDKFQYGRFISHYKKDDIETKIEEFIYELIEFVTEEYTDKLQRGETASISNFLKSDTTYKKLLNKYINSLKKRDNLKKLIEYYGALFKR